MILKNPAKAWSITAMQNNSAVAPTLILAAMVLSIATMLMPPRSMALGHGGPHHDCREAYDSPLWKH